MITITCIEIAMISSFCTYRPNFTIKGKRIYENKICSNFIWQWCPNFI